MNDAFSAIAGGRLREIRDALGLSQSDLAKALGITREQVGRYERGIAVPGGEVLAKLATLGGDVLYFLTGRRVPPPGRYEPDRDFGLLAQCIDGADAAIASAGLLVETEQRSRLYLGLYGVCAAQGGFNPALVGPMLGLLLPARTKPTKP